MKRRVVAVIAVIMMCTAMTGCKQEKKNVPAVMKTAGTMQDPLTIPNLVYQKTMKLDYAKGFQVYYYEGGYALVHVIDEGQFLVVPEGKEVPEGLSKSIKVIKRPLSNVYLVATAAMSLFDTLDAMDVIGLSGTDRNGWYIEHASQAMDQGKIKYAGKYSEPDYELLLKEGTNLAIQSTMILHKPEVKEKLEELGITVLIDRSSYEKHPLGRTEWIKLYAVLVGKESLAEKKFEEQAKVVKEVEQEKKEGKTVAYFYVSSTGTVVVKKSSDYVPKMIELAGGKYLYDGLGDESNASSGVNMTMEEFYHTAKDAEYLIYNATIDTPLDSVQDLLNKNALFRDFKAVKEGNVWCTEKSMYQETNHLGDMISDIHTMLTASKESVTDLTFMKHMQ